MPLRRLALQVLLLLALFFLSRLAFTGINYDHFRGLGIIGFLRLSFFAIRYDLSAICAVNALYILLFLLPLPIQRWHRWERFTQVIFILVNSIALLFEVSDWAYFPYNFKRSTADVLLLVSHKGDFWSVLPDYLISYWYVPLGAAAFIFLLIWGNRRICRATPLEQEIRLKRRWMVSAWQLLIYISVLCLATIGLRGGLQYIPIGLRNAVQVTQSRYVPVVLNTPFSIAVTLMTPGLEEVHYMSDTEAEKRFPFRHQYHSSGFRKKNVVLIILESGSKEFTALGSEKSYTPFLDSLMGRSLVCTQGFANGQTSAEGIPAIIAGIPTLMDEAFTTSNYGTNNITALPSVLKEYGYSSAFYHGGTNGTMSFDIFASAAGFQHYYGRSEYADERDYDGAWGIWDEPFLQYFAHGLLRMKQPFVASVFTLSAHPPYNLPDQYRNQLPAGPLPVQQCMAYTDLALRRFFETASKQPWYDNTLFVITADHASPQNSGGFYAENLGRYTIPILFFCPSDTILHDHYNEPVQQLDIMPSVLQYLGYVKPFFAYGNSIFSRDEPRFVITQSGGAYQWLERGYLLQTANKSTGFYAYPADSDCRHNLLPTPLADSQKLRMSAFIQRYRYTVIHNEMK
jgi:hypothetical protein